MEDVDTIKLQPGGVQQQPGDASGACLFHFIFPDMDVDNNLWGAGGVRSAI